MAEHQFFRFMQSGVQVSETLTLVISLDVRFTPVLCRMPHAGCSLHSGSASALWGVGSHSFSYTVYVKAVYVLYRSDSTEYRVLLWTTVKCSGIRTRTTKSYTLQSTSTATSRNIDVRSAVRVTGGRSTHSCDARTCDTLTTERSRLCSCTDNKSSLNPVALPASQFVSVPDPLR